MNRILILLAVGAFVALLCSCGDSTQSNGTNYLGEATLYLTVSDASDATLLEDVQATLDSAKGATDDKGRVTFKIQAGSHLLQVDKEDYASVRKFVTTADKASGGVSIVPDIYENLRLYKKNATINGTLYYINAKGQSVPMSGVEIRVGTTNNSTLNLAETSYSCGTTGKDGKYTCSNLPAVGANYTVYSLEKEIDGVVYPAKNLGAGASLLPGVVINRAKEDYTKASIAFILLEKPGIIENADKSKPITLKFSEAVDTSQFKSSWISVSQAVNIKWKSCDNGCTQLELTPLPDWKEGTSITIEGDITSIGNRKFGSSVNFRLEVKDVDLSGEQVKVKIRNPEDIFYDATVATFYWDKLDGAIEYDVYLKTSDTTNFELVQSVRVDSATIGINGGYAIGDKANQVRVQATNRTSKSAFSEAVEIKAEDDGKEPTYAAEGTAIFDPCGDYTLSTNKCLPDYVYAPNADPNTDGVINFYRYPNALSESPAVFATNHNLSNVLSKKQAFNKEQRYPHQYNTDTIVAYGRVFFNKPMNTKNKLSFDCDAEVGGRDACSKLTLKGVWNNNQSLKLIVTTEATRNGITDPIDITYTISGLKGENGNTFRANPGETPRVNDIKIRFATSNPCLSIATATYEECGEVTYCGFHPTTYDGYCGNYNCSHVSAENPWCDPWTYCPSFPTSYGSNCSDYNCTNVSADNGSCDVNTYCPLWPTNYNRCADYNCINTSPNNTNCNVNTYCPHWPNAFETTDRCLDYNCKNVDIYGVDSQGNETCATTYCSSWVNDYNKCADYNCHENSKDHYECRDYGDIRDDYCITTTGKLDYEYCQNQACFANFVESECSAYCLEVGNSDTQCTNFCDNNSGSGACP